MHLGDRSPGPRLTHGRNWLGGSHRSLQRLLNLLRREIEAVMLFQRLEALVNQFLAVVCAVPLGLLCAENISPVWIYQPVRRLMDAARAINEMVFAMLFIVAVGLGPFAGVLALFVHTTGTLSKLFSEAVEAIDPRPVEGIRATGARKLVEIAYGVIPQVLPLWLSFALYRSEERRVGKSVA